MSKYSNIRADKRTTFTTLDGIEIHFTPFSWDEHLLSEEGLKQEYRDRGEIVDCPQYVVKYATGAQQEFNHDAKSILQAPPGTPPEDVDSIVADQKDKWAKYLDASARFAAENQAELANLVYTESLTDITLPADNAWELRQAKRHIKVPTDPESKRLHYINTVVLKYRSDQIDLMSTVIAVSMGIVKEDDLATAVASFRDSVWGNGIQQLFGRDATGKVEDTKIGSLDIE
jgi:hypothetical protein